MTSPIDVAWLDESDKTTPLGFIGIGEVGVTGGAAAIATAVFDAAVAARPDLPITLGKVL